MANLKNIYLTEKDLGADLYNKYINTSNAARTTAKSWEELYNRYINMSPVFYIDTDGIYYWAECRQSDKHKLGDIEAVKEFIRAYSAD